MSPRDLILSISLISIVLFSTTLSSIIPPQLLVVRLSPEPMKSGESLESVPDIWKTMYPEYKAPQVEIHLLKGHVSDENWMFNEYNYSSNDYDAMAKATSVTEEKILRTDDDDMKEGEDIEDEISEAPIIPEIGSRNIITVPTYCPQGEKQDSRGRCRTVIT